MTCYGISLYALFFIVSHYFSLFAFLNTSGCPVKVKFLNWGNFARACIFGAQISREFCEEGTFQGEEYNTSFQQGTHWVLLSHSFLNNKMSRRTAHLWALSYWKWDLGAGFVGIFTLVLLLDVVSVRCLISSSNGKIYFLLWQLIAPLGRSDCYNTEPKSTPFQFAFTAPWFHTLKVKQLPSISHLKAFWWLEAITTRSLCSLSAPSATPHFTLFSLPSLLCFFSFDLAPVYLTSILNDLYTPFQRPPLPSFHSK